MKKERVFEPLLIAVLVMAGVSDVAMAAQMISEKSSDYEIVTVVHTVDKSLVSQE